jgi:Rod binding domain-containing protein
MPVAAISGVLKADPVAASSPERIARAARDFEAILLRTLLEPLQRSFSTIPGESSQAGQDEFQYMGTEALAAAMAERGGLGIADMLTRQLVRAASTSGDA